MDPAERRAAERALDPLYDQREEMPTSEFDAVHYFVNEPGRSPAPPPKLLVYLNSRLTQPALADRLGGAVDDLLTTARETTGLPMRLGNTAYQITGAGGMEGRAGPDCLADPAAALRDGRVETLAVTLDLADDRDEHLLLLVLAQPDNPDATLQLSVNPSHSLWPADATDRVGDALLVLVRRWAGPLDLTTAGVTYDRGDSYRSPWDMWYSADHRTAAPAARDHVRGYFWANLLTGAHVGRLGGLDTLRGRAAGLGLTVEPVTGDAVVLRSPGPVGAFDDARLAATKELLAPVLIPKPYVCYQGYPLRIVPDPGTAFRRVPPDAPFPRLTA